METAAMSSDQTEAATNRATAERLMRSMRERDYGSMAGAFAADVVVNSPITASFQFHGRDATIALLRIVSEAMQDLEHHDLLGSDDVWTQRFRARVHGELIEGMDLMRFDEAGSIRELTVLVRPLPGLAALAAALGPPVGRRRGAPTSIVLRMLTAPLAAITRHGDRLVGWLLRGTWGSGRRP
jgi:hypothetical protein